MRTFTERAGVLAFTTGLNRILLVAAVIALVSGAVSLAAIRGRDFAQQQGPGSPR
jgi:hypothetical protein